MLLQVTAVPFWAGQACPGVQVCVQNIPMLGDDWQTPDVQPGALAHLS